MNQHQPGDQRPQDETGPLAAQQPAAGATAVADAPPPPPYPPAAAAPKRPNPLRRVPRTAWLAAAAVVVLVGVGLGGFFLGRATADDDGGFPDRGQRPDFPGGGGPGRDGQMPGMPGQNGQDGQLPGQGQQGQPGSSTDDGTDSGTQQDSADTTAWYVVPSAA